jgi:hypothetical protein
METVPAIFSLGMDKFSAMENLVTDFYVKENNEENNNS